MGNSHATDAEKVAWYAQVWRQADKEAIADKRSGLKRQAEYWARRQLRAAIDDALRRAARVDAAADVGKIAWRGHVSRQAGTLNVRKQCGKYRTRRQLHKVVDGAMPPALWPVLSAPLRGRYEMSRMPRRRVIIS
jgi:hypothetical protein